MVSRMKVEKLALYIFIGILCVVAVFPIYWTLLGSFKLLRDIISPTPKFIFRPTLKNYINVLKSDSLRTGLINSIIVSSIATGLSFVLGFPAAYGIARFSFRHKEDLRFWLLSLRMLPPVAIVIPFLFIWIRLGLFDTYVALITTYLLVTLPAVIWLSIECFRNVPIECEEAAMIEGCSSFETFYKISLPIALPNLIGIIFLCFLLVWNEFFLALCFTSARITMPIAASAAAMLGMDIRWEFLCASIILLSIPPIILGLIFRKFIQSYFFPTR